MSLPLAEEVARKLGGQPILGTEVRSQADLALAVRNRLPLARNAQGPERGRVERAGN